MKESRHKITHSIALGSYDAVWTVIVCALVLLFNPSGGDRELRLFEVAIHTAAFILCVIGGRAFSGLYHYVWRYGSNYLNIRLMFTEVLAGIAYYILQILLPVRNITFLRAVSMATLDLIGALGMRQIYQFLYDASSTSSRLAKLFRGIARVVMGLNIEPRQDTDRINIAIVGAGRVGVSLAEDLVRNPNAAYVARCFIEIDPHKIGRSINGIPVLADGDDFSRYGIREIVFALPDVTAERKKELYDRYKDSGCKLKTYDFPTTQDVNAKRALRDFDIEELLFRPQTDFLDEHTRAFYRGQTVLISGGGGSIGSELCRQIARMEPRKLVVLDVYENCAYDIQQELRVRYGSALNLAVEIVTITDRGELDKVFARHNPDVVVHAAAHKHVPLMETNCSEAIKNNVFGTLNMVEAAEAHGVKKFIMVSTDKAVNPTNVMGATKRMCELIVLGHQGKMACSATRFGNVLGSNGSVIPLFRRQIANGGPVTLTDKRIIRYFMTIPEASQLVLTSGAMARHGELFVLDMGQPVHILNLAESMIRLSGFEPYKDIDIVEIGLRPGEKLYEELLVRTEELDKTENSMIFIERDAPLEPQELTRRLDLLARAAATNDDEACRAAMMQAVPTYRTPEEVNRNAAAAQEMSQAK